MLEAAAEKLQAALLASLEEEKPTGAQQQQDKSKRKKEKKGRRAKKALAEAEPARHVSSHAKPFSPGGEAAADTVASQGGAANGAQSAQDSDTASADTGAEQLQSSSGEGERASEVALGVAGETTSEDEWKARLRHRRINIGTFMQAFTHGTPCTCVPFVSPTGLLLLELLLATPTVVPDNMLLKFWCQRKVSAGCWQADTESSPQDGILLAGPSSAWCAATAQAQPAERPEGMQALPIAGFAD